MEPVPPTSRTVDHPQPKNSFFTLDEFNSRSPIDSIEIAAGSTKPSLSKQSTFRSKQSARPTIKLPSLSKRKNDVNDTDEYGYEDEFEEDSVH